MLHLVFVGGAVRLLACRFGFQQEKDLLLIQTTEPTDKTLLLNCFKLQCCFRCAWTAKLIRRDKINSTLNILQDILNVLQNMLRGIFFMWEVSFDMNDMSSTSSKWNFKSHPCSPMESGLI